MKTDHEQYLIRQVQQRSDRDAAGELLGLYYREIYAFSYKQVGNKDTALDLTQEIFVSFLQSIGRYDPQKASIRTWLYRIASNKAVDYFRSASYRQSRLTVNTESIVIPQETTMEEAYMDQQMISQILTELAQLPFESQQIVRLKVYGEQSFLDISKELSLAEGTVKSKYYAAMKTIREKVMKE